MLEWTGERYLPYIDPSISGVDIHYEHLHRYAFASRFVKGKKVLDLASGEGYGSYLLSQNAESVTGIDVDNESVKHALNVYNKDNLSFLQGSIINIPIAGEKLFDVIICFEAIEHIKEHEILLHEIKRLINDEGILIISTPNKQTYSDIPNYHNQFHEKELYFDEFRDLLKNNFSHEYFFGQRTITGSNIFPLSLKEFQNCTEFEINKENDKFSFEKVDEKIPIYFVAIASNVQLNDLLISKSFLIDTSNTKISLLSDQVAVKERQIHEISDQVAVKERQIHEISDQVAVKERQIHEISDQVINLKQTVAVKDQEINRQYEQVNILRQENTTLKHSISYVILSKFYNVFVKPLFPHNTKRREIYDLGLKGGRIFVNEGGNSFCRHFKGHLRARKYKRQIRKTVQGPQSFPDTGIFSREIENKNNPLEIDHIPNPNNLLDVDNLEKLTFTQHTAPTVSIIIPVYNKWQYTYNCLKSILENSVDITYEVIIADDCSNDQTEEMLKKVEGIEVIKNEHNLGYLKNCNNAVKFANGQYVVYLNNDTYVMKGWLVALLEPAIKNDNVGIVGPNLLSTNGMLLENGWIIGVDGWGQPIGRGDDPSKFEYNYLKEVDCVTGACFLLKKEIFINAGLFDEKFSPAYYEEFDFAFSVRKMGYKVLVQPKSIVIHYDNSSYGKDTRDRLSVINHQKFMDRWSNLLKNRPEIYYDYFLARDNTAGKKIILIIDDRVPDYDKYAGSLMMYQYVKLFQDLGFKVIFLPDSLEKVEPYTLELQQMGVEVIYGIFDFDSWIHDNGKYLDIIWLSRPMVAINYIDKIKANSDAKILYCMHDLHYLRELRRYEVEKDENILKESQRCKDTEFRLFTKADIVLTFSNVEARIISKELPNLHNLEVIPLFVYDDFPESTSLPPFDTRQNLIFLGGFGHLPNVDAVLWFLRECFPTILSKNPNIKFLIMGSNPPKNIKKLASENIIITGQIKDLKPYFENAKVFVCPLRYGAGVKGKLVTSMYYGVPIVTTTIGAEGLGIIDKENALVADGSDDFASMVIELYTNKDLWEKLSENSLEHVKNTFSKQEVSKKLLNILRLHKCHICGAFYEFSASVDTNNLRETTLCPKCGAIKRWDDVAAFKENNSECGGESDIIFSCKRKSATPKMNNQMTDSTLKERTMNDNEGLICLHPFYSMLIFQNYNVYNCVCLDWIKQSIGNLKTNSLSECWNSETARYIRRKMYSGEWKDICNPICPVIIEYLDSHKLIKYEDLDAIDGLSPALIDEIRARKDFLKSPPTHFKLDNSNVCNLHCIMCSRDAFKDDPILQKKFMAEFQNYLPSAKKLMLCGHGDPLARPDTREILMNHKGSIKFDIISNGLLLPKYWEKIKHQKYGTMMISMDAATKETYEKIRAGGRWENILQSLLLIKNNRDSFESISLNMTVMRSNYQEIPSFIDLAEFYGFNVYFQGIRGAYPDENIFETKDFNAINELRIIVANETKKKRSINVSWGNLSAYLN